MSQEVGAGSKGAAQAYGRGSRASSTITETHHHYGGPLRQGDSAIDPAMADAHLADLPLDQVPAPSPLPSGSRMPWPVNRTFVGRESDLKALAAILKGGETAAIGQVAAATGLGGIGKTQLAAAFVHAYGQYFLGGVYWLSLADAASVPSEIAQCGAAMVQEAGFGSLPIEEQVRLVTNAWQSPLPRLLVFDNCEDEDLLARWRPASGGCRVLVTSRRQTWPVQLGVRDLTLGVLSAAESVALLRKHRPDLPAEDPALAGIGEELGHLPLALHLAGSFLERYRHADAGRPEAYLEALQRADLLAHRSLATGERSLTGQELDVAKTFALSLERLDKAEPGDALARRLLARAACFAPGQPIPRALLLATLSEAEDGDLLKQEDALCRLLEQGLLTPEVAGRLVLHRLLGRFVQVALGDLGAARTAVETTVAVEASRLNQEGYPAPLLAWQDHLLFVAERAVERGSERAGQLQNELGYHLAMIADLGGAKAAYERALEIDRAALGPHHPDVAIRLDNLGVVLRNLGDLAGAKTLHKRALAIDEAAFGPEHPDVAIRLNNLGVVLRKLGDLAGAKVLYERALAIDEAVFGSDHPKVAMRINNLAVVLRHLGDLTGAKALYERAIAIDEAVFGPNHPKVAMRINNLGVVLRNLGDLAGAKASYERALAIDEAVFGPNHPKVAMRINNLAVVLRHLGDLTGAKALYERAIAIDAAVFGPNHSKIAIRVDGLASVLKDQGDLAGAKALYERALAIDEALFAPEHPKIAVRVNNLGSVLRAQGDLAGARAAYERALAIDEAAFGPDHPNVAIRVNNLGGVLKATGDLAGARDAYERALAIFETRLGPEHPSTRTVRENLAILDHAD